MDQNEYGGILLGLFLIGVGIIVWWIVKPEKKESKLNGKEVIRAEKIPANPIVKRKYVRKKEEISEGEGVRSNTGEESTSNTLG